MKEFRGISRQTKQLEWTEKGENRREQKKEIQQWPTGLCQNLCLLNWTSWVSQTNGKRTVVHLTGKNGSQNIYMFQVDSSLLNRDWYWPILNEWHSVLFNSLLEDWMQNLSEKHVSLYENLQVFVLSLLLMIITMNVISLNQNEECSGTCLGPDWANIGQVACPGSVVGLRPHHLPTKTAAVFGAQKMFWQTHWLI